MDNRQLSCHSQYCAFGCRIGQLWCRASNECYHAGCIDYGSFRLVVLAHAQDSVLATEPNAFDIDVVGKIPDLLGSVNGIGILAAIQGFESESFILSSMKLEATRH